jgi:hypothetical protein
MDNLTELYNEQFYDSGMQTYCYRNVILWSREGFKLDIQIEKLLKTLR